jgi:hypothetical protein
VEGGGEEGGVGVELEEGAGGEGFGGCVCEI